MKKLIVFIVMLFLAANCSAQQYIGPFVDNDWRVTTNNTMYPLQRVTKDKLVIWSFSDIQPINEAQWTEFNDVILDMNNNVDFDLAIVAGDLVNSGGVATDYDKYIERIRKSEHSLFDFFHLAGNHERAGDADLSNYLQKIPNQYRYSVLVGNLLFIFMSDEVADSNGQIGTDTFEWWKDLVVNNQDKDIITITHQPLYDTTVGSTGAGTYIEDTNRFSNVLENYNVDLWIHGHIETTLEQSLSTVEKWGTLHMNNGLHIECSFEPCSRVITFTEGSNTVNIKLRNHVINDYNDTYEVNYTLSHPAEISNAVLYDGRFATSIKPREISTKNLDVNNVTVSELIEANSVDINGGTIDNTVIGGATPAAGTFTKVTDSSLIGYYKFNGDINDSSYYGNDGTGGGGNENTNNDVLNLDGAVGSYVEISNEIIPDGWTGGWSGCCWFKAPASAVRMPLFNTTGSFAMALWLESDGDITAYVSTSSGYKLIRQDDIPCDDNIWYFALATFNPNDKRLRLYVNGVLVATSSALDANDLAATSGFEIGHDDNGRYFTGSIDEVRMYNRALSAAEIRRLYESSIRNYGHFNDIITGTLAAKSFVESSLVGYYKFNGDVNDSSFYGNDGTLKGSANVNNDVLNLDGTNNSHVSINYDFAGNTFDLAVRRDQGRISAYINDAWYISDTGNTINQGEWYHYVLVSDGTDTRAYFNGALIATASGHALPNVSSYSLWARSDSASTTDYQRLLHRDSATDFRIGTYSWGGTTWNGAIDEVKIYDRALSAAEVRRLYESSIRNYGHFNTIFVQDVAEVNDVVVGGTAHFGDDANYMSVSDTGIATLHGDAKGNLILRPDLNFARVSAFGKPTLVVYGAYNGFSLPLYAGDDEELFFSQNVPGRWDGESDITVHVLVALADEELPTEVGDANVYQSFNLQLSWANTEINEPLLNTTTDPCCQTITEINRTDAYDIYKVKFTIDYDANAGNPILPHDLLTVRLRRVPVVDAEEANCEIIVLDWHTHFIVNKIFKAVE